MELTDFHHQFNEEIGWAAFGDKDWKEPKFFEKFCEALCEMGALATADYARFFNPDLRVRVDGYGGDPVESDNVLSLIVCDYDQSDEINTLTERDMNRTFKLLERFVLQARDPKFRHSMEDGHPGSDLAELIHARWSDLRKVEFYLITNKRLSRRIDGIPADDLNGMPVSYTVWDIERLHRFDESGGGREDMVIDLDEFGGYIPVLPVSAENDSYTAYLGTVTGPQLADIYGRWRARLLEANVRLFLQFRGAVNRGIRSTLENEPHMFFAYNNGITATAESVKTITTDEGTFLTEMTNFQIVNGGQTTASIFAVSKNISIDLTQVRLQMKLAIVDPDHAVHLVPNISKFANSQNRVSDADFFSNHPFHIEFEKMSRRILAPAQAGTVRESKWFYERARGQYQDAKAYLTAAKQREFDAEYPKNQLMSKTDLGKFLNVWEFKPDLVSRGAQTNFASFANGIIKDWESDRNQFSEEYFRRSISKAIIFKEVEKLVPKQTWYEGGYRANVVAYSIAKLAYDIDQLKLAFDFSKVWTPQSISNSLSDILAVSAKAVHEVITDPPSQLGNRSEWAKRAACWERVKKLEIDWPEPLENLCITKKRDNELVAVGKKDQDMVIGIDAQIKVVNIEASIWLQLKEWESSRGILTPPEQNALRLAANAAVKLPREQDCRLAIECLYKLADLGSEIALDQKKSLMI